MVVKFTSSSIANGFFLATDCLSLHSTKSILCCSLYLLLFLCKFCSKGYTHWHIHCVFVCAEKSLHWIRPFTLLYMTKSRAFHAHTIHQMALINFKHPYSQIELLISQYHLHKHRGRRQKNSWNQIKQFSSSWNCTSCSFKLFL